MAYGGIMFYNLHMPLYILGTFTEYPYFYSVQNRNTASLLEYGENSETCYESFSEYFLSDFADSFQFLFFYQFYFSSVDDDEFFCRKIRQCTDSV